LVRRAARLGALALACRSAVASAYAGSYGLAIEKGRITITGQERDTLGVNGSFPGPELHFREGEDVTINGTGNLDEDASIHRFGSLSSLSSAFEGR